MGEKKNIIMINITVLLLWHTSKVNKSLHPYKKA